MEFCYEGLLGLVVEQFLLEELQGELEILVLGGLLGCEQGVLVLQVVVLGLELVVFVLQLC